MHRLFVAVDLPETIKDRLAEICFGLPGAKWVKPEQLHLTLRFIGEVDGATFMDIRAALATIALPPFSLGLKGLGCFPPRKTPRVLWVGLEPPLEQLVQLRNRVEATLVRLGVEPEHRKFAPHITLARLKETPKNRLANFLAGNSLFSTESFPVENFHLYSSSIGSKGAIHTLEASYPLTGSTDTMA
ncbi:MAG: RNA 2',3'-cyclic phosphodiesterase [Desulfobulbaceae bacterium]|nr:RNA 2',3'-cyclic phosphodiesterase [Desulfobulbaceae bacterium]